MKEILRYAARDYKNIIKRLLWVTSIGLCTTLYAAVNSNSRQIYDVATAIDAAIPFNQYFVIPYVIWYAYVGFYLFYFAVYDGKKFFKLIWGIICGMLFCCIIYYFFQTGIERPYLTGNDVFTKMVKLIYSSDKPYNCCPSLHVFDSVLIAVYVNRDRRPSLNTKIISTITSILIILSTMFIKQHYFMDGVTGAALAYFIYSAFNYDEIAAKITGKKAPYIQKEQI